MTATIKTTVPSARSVEVPETLLKKKRSDQQAREARVAKAAEAKKVRLRRKVPTLVLVVMSLGVESP